MKCITERLQREKERKRQEIIDAAEKLFFKEGFKETSMDEIAKKAEFSKRTVYKYFDSKEELYSAIALRGVELFHKVIEESAAGEKNGFGKLSSIANSLIKLKNDNLNYTKVIIYFLSQALYNNSNLENIQNCRDMVVNIKILVNKFIKQGIEDGSIKKDIDISRTVMSFQTILVGMYMINDNIFNYFTTDNITFNDIFEYNINLMLNIIKN
ncbi:MAG TPA: TetR/AcrR family transcriptional regulator [Spirochaetota bacterium]|nr:TetR/AcrR family transcriptional regulator [Spirochaetota bacterium]